MTPEQIRVENISNISKELVEDLYLQQNLSKEEAARQLGITWNIGEILSTTMLHRIRSPRLRDMEMPPTIIGIRILGLALSDMGLGIE